MSAKKIKGDRGKVRQADSQRARDVAQAARAVDAVDAARVEIPGRRHSAKRPSDLFLGEFRRRDIFPLLVLHFCSSEPSYGNHLITQIEQLTAGIMSVNPNTIYPLLREMESKGLIAGQWEHPEKRSRRFYSITESGSKEYQRLREAVEPFLDSLVRGVTLIRQEIYGK